VSFFLGGIFDAKYLDWKLQKAMQSSTRKSLSICCRQAIPKLAEKAPQLLGFEHVRGQRFSGTLPGPTCNDEATPESPSFCHRVRSGVTHTVSVFMAQRSGYA
jgi:hypothetical protein